MATDVDIFITLLAIAIVLVGTDSLLSDRTTLPE